jgi:hypothetical protein
MKQVGWVERSEAQYDPIGRSKIKITITRSPAPLAPQLSKEKYEHRQLNAEDSY